MNEEHTNACRKCGGAMKPGQAMQQTVECGDEGTCSPAGPGVLVDCMKCERCGWSVTAGGPEALPPVHIDVERMRKALAGPRTLIPQGLSAQEMIDFINANAGVVEGERNQCDGCAQGAPLRGDLHIDKDGHAFMACQKDRYTPGVEASFVDIDSGALLNERGEPLNEREALRLLVAALRKYATFPPGVLAALKEAEAILGAQALQTNPVAGQNEADLTGNAPGVGADGKRRDARGHVLHGCETCDGEDECTCGVKGLPAATDALALMREVHDVLESTADSDLDHFESEEEEREAVPVQYAARKLFQAIQLLEATPGVKEDGNG